MILIVLPDIPAEDELLAQARRGNENALMQIYDSYFPPVYNFIRLRVEDVAMAEDLASEVFLQFVAAVRGKTAPRHSLRGWLFRVARHTLYDHYGKRQKFTTTALEEWIPAPMSDDPEIEFIHSLDVQRARHALRMLADDQQEVLILRFGHALDLQQTADVMGKSVSAVKSLQFRAVNTLRRILGEIRLEVSNG